ncbi:MbnP family protein [Hymenobacter ruricola]|uniref:Copper-binding protein MbnP-like domain-containing protein n=1 Tax=Hymenobacter ruricola TaxID=2791023 RepID=A0ABS0I6Y2_9BACT|nr:MbnP family protein [Hymenobacter ruricola]MBF9222730.1 hypothetical protein [Hymenobacter ruricola]
MIFRLLSCFVALLALPGLRPAAMPGRRIVVQPVLQTIPLVLDGPAVRTSAGDDVSVTMLRCYLGPLTLHFTDGTTYHDPAAAHLLDLEEANSWIIDLPQAPAKPVAAVAFSVGIDSAASTGGAQGGPLDPALGMYWAWQSGYINAKIEGHSPSRPASVRRAFAFHIGGYARPYATRRPVRLPLPTPSPAATLTLLADADKWLGAAPLAQTPDVQVPGAAAAAQADRVAAMFRWPAAAAATPSARARR